MTKVYKVEFEAATNLIICTAVYFLSDIAEVVGSTPTQSISSCSGNTGTGSRLFKKFSPPDLRCICMTLSLFFISSNLKTMVEVSNSQMEAFHPSIPTLQNG
jgi:hypothetical protein